MVKQSRTKFLEVKLKVIIHCSLLLLLIVVTGNMIIRKQDQRVKCQDAVLFFRMIRVKSKTMYKRQER